MGLPRRSLWRRRALLLAVAAVFAVIAVLLAVSGGFRATVGGLSISARSPLAATVAAMLAGVVWYWLARRAKAVQSDLDAAWSAIELRASPIVLALSALAAAVAAIFATYSAAGADASGYLSEAVLWASGGRFYTEDLAPIAGAADPWLTAPLGWRPAPLSGLQAPTYPPGLPLLMAIPHAIGGTVSACLVVALGAGLAVWSTGALAILLAGEIAGVVAAVALAASPVFLYHSIQPMSDVPVTAAWMLCWWLLVADAKRIGIAGGRKPSGLSIPAGIACALAVLIRPNLAPLAVVPLAFVLLRHPSHEFRFRQAVAFSLPVVFAGLVLMWLQWTWYGSPIRSGYGTAGELFALANVGANATRYFWWTLTTAPVVLLAPLGLVMVWRRAPARALTAFALLVVVAYLLYAVFDIWSYLRFLLPALAVAAGFAGAAVAAVLSRMPLSLRAAALLVVLLGLVAHGVSQGRAVDTFRLADQLRRVAQAGDFLKSVLPAEGVIIAGEQSGALRYYTGRSILRWEAASPDGLSRAIDAVAASGRPIAIALDAWEDEPFRTKFAGVAALALDWPPALEAGTSHRTRVWRLRDRDVFLRGERVRMERVP